MKNLIKTFTTGVLLLALCTSAFAEIPENEKCAADGEYSPFGLNIYLDSGLLSAGIGGTGTAYYLKNTMDLPEWDGTKFDLGTVNPIDAFVAHPYNESIHQIATVTCGVSLAIPAGVFLTESLCSNMPWGEFGKVSLMYAESFFMSYAIKDILKVTVHRVRPYMYFDETDYSADSNDWQYSFPSGHTTNAFLGASFASYVFCTYYPDSAWKIPVVVTSYAIAAATGVMRMYSGNHFLTDVLTGAAIGTACGIGVPALHKLIASNPSSEKISEVMSVSPMGVNIELRF